MKLWLVVLVMLASSFSLVLTWGEINSSSPSLLGRDFGPGNVFVVFVVQFWVLLFCGFHFKGSFHVGADVPADSFELSHVDQIIVWMGFKDHIMASLSTFLTKLSETALMLVRFVSGSKDFHCTLLLCLWFYRLFAESKTTFLSMYKLISMPILVLIFIIIN